MRCCTAALLARVGRGSDTPTRSFALAFTLTAIAVDEEEEEKEEAAVEERGGVLDGDFDGLGANAASSTLRVR